MWYQLLAIHMSAHRIGEPCGVSNDAQTRVSRKKRIQLVLQKHFQSACYHCLRQRCIARLHNQARQQTQVAVNTSVAVDTHVILKYPQFQQAPEDRVCAR